MQFYILPLFIFFIFTRVSAERDNTTADAKQEDASVLEESQKNLLWSDFEHMRTASQTVKVETEQPRRTITVEPTISPTEEFRHWYERTTTMFTGLTKSMTFPFSAPSKSVDALLKINTSIKSTTFRFNQKKYKVPDRLLRKKGYEEYE